MSNSRWNREKAKFIKSFNEIDWRRIIKEYFFQFTLIVLAVVVGMWVNDWHSNNQASSNFNHFKVTLKNEISENRIELESDMNRFHKELNICDKLLGIEVDSIALNFGNLATIPWFNPSHATLDLIKSRSGTIEQLEDMELVDKLLKLDKSLSDINARDTRHTHYIERYIIPIILNDLPIHSKTKREEFVMQGNTRKVLRLMKGSIVENIRAYENYRDLTTDVLDAISD